MQLLLQLQDVVDVDYDDNGDHDDHEHEDGKDDQLPSCTCLVTVQ